MIPIRLTVPYDCRNVQQDVRSKYLGAKYGCLKIPTEGNRIDPYELVFVSSASEKSAFSGVREYARDQKLNASIVA